MPKTGRVGWFPRPPHQVKETFQPSSTKKTGGISKKKIVKGSSTWVLVFTKLKRRGAKIKGVKYQE